MFADINHERPLRKFLMKEIEEAYIRMLTESPYLNANDTPESMHSGSLGIRKFISDNHSHATDLGDGHFRLKHATDTYVNYRHDGKEPKELSYISKNTQTGVEKGPNGDANHIHSLMRKHVNDFGELHSSNSNTNGSKKLWLDFAKKNTDLKFHVNNNNVNKKIQVDHTYLEKHQNSIWGDDKSVHSNIRLSASK